MKKIITIIKLGIKYLYRYRRRYYFLLAALIFGFTVVTFISSTKDGMYDSAYYAAQSHYAGDIVAVGYDHLTSIDYRDYRHYIKKDDVSAILKSVEEANINVQHTVLRTMRMANTVIHHIGHSVQTKYLIGCDWDKEEHIFKKMDFVSQLDSDIGDDGIILSVPVARQLEAKTGDSIILETETRYLQKNTGVFIVKGIVNDTSIFGYYKAYISRTALNRLILFDDDDCTTMGFFLKDPSKAEKQRIRLNNTLSSYLQTGNLVYNREEMDRERYKHDQGTVFFLYTLPVYLSEISDILDALNILTVLLYAMMLLTILASASVTYSLILNERSKEMGVMRTIGFYGADLHLVLWTEIVIISVISMIIGFIFSCILSWAASFLSFSWFPGFELFLRNERLLPMYLPKTILSNIAMLLFVIIILVFFQSSKVAKKELPNLLSGEPL